MTQETHFANGGAQIRRTETAYDALSRSVRTTQSPANVVTAFTYATAANRVSSAIITHAGLTTNITYDANGCETTRAVTAAGVDLRSAVTSRNAEGRRVASTVASLSARASFDAAGKLTAQTGPGISANYTYDTGTGRKIAETVTVTGVAAVTSAYGYSETGRLVSARTGATQRTYSLDDRGNLGVATTGNVRTTLLFDGDDRLTTSTAGTAVTSYRYDSLGRRIRQATGSVITTYTWDAASRLTGWQRGTSNAAYTYDGAGQRTRAVITRFGATTTTEYVYDGIVLRSLAATQGASNWRLAYLYDEEGRPYAGVYTSGTAGPVTFLISTPDRGDVVALTNMAGHSFARYTYDPYGNVLTATSNTVGGSITTAVAAAIAERQPLRYAGYVYDAHSQTYYLSQRHYDPATMRFLSKGPIRADGEESAYQYAAGDPVGKVDPTGLWAEKYIYNVNSTGFTVRIRRAFNLRAYCLAFSIDLIWRKGNRSRWTYLGMGPVRIAAELYAHAVAHYSAGILSRLGIRPNFVVNKKQRGLEAHVNNNEGRKMTALFYAIWWGSVRRL